MAPRAGSRASPRWPQHSPGCSLSRWRCSLGMTVSFARCSTRRRPSWPLEWSPRSAGDTALTAALTTATRTAAALSAGPSFIAAHVPRSAGWPSATACGGQSLTLRRRRRSHGASWSATTPDNPMPKPSLSLSLSLSLTLTLTLTPTLTLTLTLSLSLTQGGHAPVRPRLQRRVSGGARERRGSVLHVRDAADPGPTRGQRRRRTCEAVTR